jgi:hypothetical protein
MDLSGGEFYGSAAAWKARHDAEEIDGGRRGCTRSQRDRLDAPGQAVVVALMLVQERVGAKIQ